MIVCVTLNPLIEERYSINSFTAGGFYRDSERSYCSGGKGINVSRQLKLLGIESINITFIGGTNGKRLQTELEKEKLKLIPIRTEEETRSGFTVSDETTDTVTTLMGPAAKVNSKEVAELIAKAKRAIENGSCLVCCGSSPSPEADEVFAELIRFANELDRVSILDSYGNSLVNAVNAGPLVLHTTIKEALDSGLLEGYAFASVERYFNLLQEKGIKEVFLTNGEKNFFVMQFGYIYEVSIPAVKNFSAIGSGDAFVAGLIYGMENDFIFADTVKTAVKLGAINATQPGTCTVKPEQLLQFTGNVHLEPVGAKRLRSS